MKPRIEVRSFSLTELRVDFDYDERGEPLISASCMVLDRTTGRPGPIVMRKYTDSRIWECMSPAHRQAFVYDLLRQVVLHELDECFFVDGVRVRDPHRDEGAR